MKKILKIAIIFLAVAMLPACSAQRRAERKVRRAVELCPELVQVKAHPIDAVLTVPAFTDHGRMPLKDLLSCDSISTRTEHGTITVSLDREDDTLCVGFTSDPQQVTYRDTIRYSQVTVNPNRKQNKQGWSFKNWLSTLCLGSCLGISFILWILQKKDKDKS